MKRSIALTAVIMIMICLCLPVCAAEAAGITPRYTYTTSVSARITVDDYGIAYCQGKCVAKSDVPVSVVVYLEQYNAYTGEWVELMSWSASGRAVADKDGMFMITTGYQYRTYTVGYVYNSNNVLVETVYAEDTMYY